MNLKNTEGTLKEPEIPWRTLKEPQTDMRTREAPQTQHTDLKDRILAEYLIYFMMFEFHWFQYELISDELSQKKQNTTPN